MTKTLMVAVVVVMLCAPAVMAQPPYNNAEVVTNVWDITITNPSGDDWNWLVTLKSGAIGIYGGIIQDAQEFIVYDDDEGTNPGSDLGWTASTAGNPSMGWKRTGSDAYLLPGESKNFWATIATLENPNKVVLHVRELTSSGKVETYFARQVSNGEGQPGGETPELSTWLLLSLSGLAGAFVARRRRS